MSLNVFISGYGPFMDIKVNPADELAKQLEADWDRVFGSVNINLVERVTLPVTVPAVHDLIANWKAKIAEMKAANPQDRFLVVHIGVNANITAAHIEFERFCNNRRIMNDEGGFYEDEPGERPVTDTLEMNHISQTNFDIERIVNSVHKFNKWATINYDPGDYLCNFIYLESVIKLQDDDTNSFFLHIPDNWDWFHFEKETVYQFILRYAGLYHPRLCFIPSEQWGLAEGETLDQKVEIETEVNQEKFPGGGAQEQESKTKGTLNISGVGLKLKEGEGEVKVVFKLISEAAEAEAELDPVTGNLADMNFEGEFGLTVVTGEELVEVVVEVDGERAFAQGMPVEQVMGSCPQDGSKTQSLWDLLDEVNKSNPETGAQITFEVSFEKSWC